MNSLLEKFYEAVVAEDRYLLFLDGFKTTLILIVFSFFIGTFGGMLITAGNQSKIRVIRKATKILCRFLTRVPTLVLLMIFIHVIFGSNAVPLLITAVIVLTLKASAYLSGIFDAALATIDKSEVEAAHTLGLTRFQTFRFIILPQATATALPLYDSQFDSSLLETSVVGYIAINDLTYAASTVSDRTLDAFFALGIATILYFALNSFVKILFRIIFRKYRKGDEKA